MPDNTDSLNVGKIALYAVGIMFSVSGLGPNILSFIYFYRQGRTRITGSIIVQAQIDKNAR